MFLADAELGGYTEPHTDVPEVSPRTFMVDSLFASHTGPDMDLPLDFWGDAPSATQPTQGTQQEADVTPPPAGRDRRPPDAFTYPTEQIRQRKKAGPSKRGKGPHD